MAAHYFRRNLRYIGFNGTGKQVRDFLHIEDLADLVLAQVHDMERYRGRVFNVGGGLGCSLSLRECTELCREITGNAVPIAPVPENRPADVRIYMTDHCAISQIAGWRPRREARETLADIHDWIHAEEATVESVLLGSMS
jgi:CDP-paratose 2-epimerase